MVFTPPSWVPQITCEASDSVPVGDFTLKGSSALQGAGKPPFVDGITGKSCSLETLREHVDWTARGLAKEFGWSPNEGSPWDKVVAINSLNTLDYFVLCWAVHRLNGICLPIHSSSSVAEITTHMTKSQCRTIFTCQSLISTCLDVAKELSIPQERVYILPLPENYMQDAEPTDKFKSIEQLTAEGSQLEPLEPLQWKKGQGKTQVAYLCSTSGTSGKQKLAMLTHYALVKNAVQMTAHEDYVRKGFPEVVTGVIPFSHSYGIFLVHASIWRGDSIISFPRFDMQLMLKSIATHQIERLYVVPPILAALAANPFLLNLFDLSSVKYALTGAGPLSRSLTDKLHTLVPKWKFLHGYGLTETSVAASCTSDHDVWHGSSGSLLPDYQMRIIGPNEEEITAYDEPGEVLFKSDNLFIGYLGDEEATKNSFDTEGWMRTGDVGMVRVSPSGIEHLFIVDRIKDMIKVKGSQVVPSDIETVLFKHPAVTEAAVIGVPDEIAGERPLAFVARSRTELADLDEEDLKDNIDEHVQGSGLDEIYWLHDRIVFLSEIPKSQSGKVLKKDLRTMVPGNQLNEPSLRN